MIFLNQFLNSFNFLFLIDKRSFHSAFFLCNFRTQQYIFIYGKRRHQLKMLVHHPYPVCNRINRAVQCNFFPPDQDFSACWLQQSVEHIHHCRFSCTVFTYNTFNLLFFYIQINMIICDKIVKLFGQINRLYHAVHIAASFLSKQLFYCNIRAFRRIEFFSTLRIRYYNCSI